MLPELKEMIENGEISEVEIVGFIRTLRKLSKRNIMDKRNVDMVVSHFEMKRKKGWLKIEQGVKIRI